MAIMNKQALYDSTAACYVLSYLMRNPNLLLFDKFLLTTTDFYNNSHRLVFGAIYNLATSDVKNITAEHIAMDIGKYPEAAIKFGQEGGISYVKTIEAQDANEEGLFKSSYNTLKKYTILRDLEKAGINTQHFYNTSNFLEADETMARFNAMEPNQIIDSIRVKLSQIERSNIDTAGDHFQDVASGLGELFKSFATSPAVGPELEGTYLNSLIRGARPGRMMFLSAPSGHGKTRTMVGQACHLSLPCIRDGKVIVPSDLRRSYYIATEQEIREIQTIILAYVSGVNESSIVMNTLNNEERETVQTAIRLVNEYKDNLYLDRYTNPTIDSVRARIVEKILDKGIENVFYDYIFIPTETREDKGSHQYRSDQNLMRMSNMLKEVAATYQVFMVSGSQVSGQWQGAKFRDTTYLRDAKSLADKIDFGLIGSKINEDELNCVRGLIDKNGMGIPNYVTDIYKNRDGVVSECKIFSIMDFGTATRKDLFATTLAYNLIEDITKIKYDMQPTITSLLEYRTREDQLT